jgi:hypothetical protein
MEQSAFNNINNCLNTNIYSYFETSGGQSSNLHLDIVYFFNTMLIRHVWQLKKIVSLKWCLKCAVLNSQSPALFSCTNMNINNREITEASRWMNISNHSLTYSHF